VIGGALDSQRSLCEMDNRQSVAERARAVAGGRQSATTQRVYAVRLATPIAAFAKNRRIAYITGSLDRVCCCPSQLLCRRSVSRPMRLRIFPLSVQLVWWFPVVPRILL
jgi:hypothetical protein